MNYGSSSRLSVEQVLAMAEHFFGPRGLGLRVVGRAPRSLQLAGPPGRVGVRAQPSGGSTEVFLTAEGLDEQARRFMVEVFEEAHLH